MAAKRTPITVDEVMGLWRALASNPGLKHSVKAQELIFRLGLRPQADKARSGGYRRLCQIARAAVTQGYPICSGNGGYYVPASFDDLEVSARRQESQGKGILKKVKQLRAAGRLFLKAAA